MATEVSARELDRVSALRAAAAGRCQCAGECGETHNWTAEDRALPCRAPHGVRIVRKRDNPSYWQVVRTDDDGELVRPAALRSKYREKVVEVELWPVTAPDGREIVVCQRCRLLTEQRTEASQ